MECRGVFCGICLLRLSGKRSHQPPHMWQSGTQPGGTHLTLLLVSTVPPVPVPLGSEETESLRPVDGCPPLQPLPVWPEEPVAADVPHFCRLPLRRPQPHPETSGQKQRLWGVSSGGLLACTENTDHALLCLFEFTNAPAAPFVSWPFISDSVDVTSTFSKEYPAESASL